MFLALQLVTNHVAGEEGIYFVNAGVFHGLQDGRSPHLAQGGRVLFLHRNLTNANNTNRSHLFTCFENKELHLFQDFAWKKSINTDRKKHGKEIWLWLSKQNESC
jgi:hypothetical protein